MSSINVYYFALLREQAKKEKETLEFKSQTYQELYQELAKKYQFNLPCSMIQVAVNDEFGKIDSLVKSGDKIVFIPPVAGG